MAAGGHGARRGHLVRGGQRRPAGLAGAGAGRARHRPVARQRYPGAPLARPRRARARVGAGLHRGGRAGLAAAAGGAGRARAGRRPRSERRGRGGLAGGVAAVAVLACAGARRRAAGRALAGSGGARTCGLEWIAGGGAVAPAARWRHRACLARPVAGPRARHRGCGLRTAGAAGACVAADRAGAPAAAWPAGARDARTGARGGTT